MYSSKYGLVLSQDRWRNKVSTPDSCVSFLTKQLPSCSCWDVPSRFLSALCHCYSKWQHDCFSTFQRPCSQERCPSLKACCALFPSYTHRCYNVSFALISNKICLLFSWKCNCLVKSEIGHYVMHSAQSLWPFRLHNFWLLLFCMKGEVPEWTPSGFTALPEPHTCLW